MDGNILILFQLHAWDANTFILKPNEMNAITYSLFHARIIGLPERRFSRQLEAWLIPQTEKNIAYLLDTFSKNEYEIDEFTRDMFEYTSKTKELQDLKARRRWRYIFKGEVPILTCEYKTEPYNHQVVGLDAIHGSEFFGLLMEMGTGKTKIIIDEICWTQASKVLIVCPKTVIGTWIREFRKHATQPYHIKRLRSHHRGIEDLLMGLHAKQKIKIWITNYDRVRLNMESLTRMKFDVLVADESTYIKSARAKRTKAMIELGESCARRFILTGSPAGNTLLDLYAQFQFLQAGVLGYSNYHAFKRHYERFRRIKGGFEKLIGYRSIKELQARMASCSFVVKKKDCLDLPEKIFEERYVEMGQVQRELYEQMVAIALADIEGKLDASSTVQAQIVIVQLLRLAQICCGYLKCIDGTEREIPDGKGKLEALRDIIESSDPDTKLCVWARFRWDVRQIIQLLTKMKVSWVCLTGKESEYQRERNIESFASDVGARVLVGEPGSGGMGVTLIGSEARPCTTVVYYSCDFSMLKRVQSEDRSHRIGIKSPITYIDIVYEGSVEERIVKVLQAKKELNEKIKDYRSIRDLLLGREDEDKEYQVIKTRKREVPVWIHEQLQQEMSAISAVS